MNNVRRHIEFLLQTHDCVIIPELGAVLGRYVPAYYDESCGVFHAPEWEFTFNSGLLHGDGLLVSSVARSLGTSYNSASRIVTDEVAEMRSNLMSDRKLSLGRIGMLTVDDAGSIIFQPSSENTQTPSLAWLPDLSVSTVEERTERVHNDIPSEIFSTSASDRGSGKRQRILNIFKVAASIAVLVAVAFIASTPVDVEDAQYASVGIEQFGRAESERHTSDLIRRPGTATAPVVLVVSPYEDAEIPLDEEEPKPAKTVPAKEADKYCLVVASLGSQDEAERFILNNSGSDLGVLVKDGRYRVFAVTGSSIDDVIAKAEARNLSSLYPSSWVCRR